MCLYRRISIANGIATAGSGFGTLAMGPLMHLTVTKLGWQNSVRVLAAVVLVCAISGGLYRVPNTDNSPKKKEISQKKPLFQFSVLKNKAFLVWCVSLGIFMVGYFVPFVHLVSTMLHLYTLKGDEELNPAAIILVILP